MAGKKFAVPMGHVTEKAEKAQKRATRAAQRFSEGDEQPLHVRIPAELHKRLRRKALEEDTTARELVIKALQAIL